VVKVLVVSEVCLERRAAMRRVVNMRCSIWVCKEGFYRVQRVGETVD